MSRKRKTHENSLREVAAGLVRADLFNYAATCVKAADYIATLEKELGIAPGSAPGAKELCPHGFVLADNTCGPCSEGRPNRHPAAQCQHTDIRSDRIGDLYCQDCGDLMPSAPGAKGTPHG